MSSKPVLIHTHFHKRRTGVTRSIENVLPFFKDDYETFIYGYNVEGTKISFSKLRSLLFSDREVVVHCHRNNEILRMILFRFFGAKFTLVASRHAETKPSSLTLKLLKKADNVVTLIKSMSESLGIENTVVAHGVDTNSFIPNPKKKLTNITQENIILCAGRVRKTKGQKTLLQATIPILSKNPNWALVIVGKVDKQNFREELTATVNQFKLQNQVYFIDETSDIISYYQASKIAVVPSFSEGFSLVTAEAMSCGCSVIATKNVGVHSDLITHGKNGYLFEAGNTSELETLLSQKISNKIPFLGEEARKEIVKSWSAEREAKGLIKIYNLKEQ